MIEYYVILYIKERKQLAMKEIEAITDEDGVGKEENNGEQR